MDQRQVYLCNKTSAQESFNERHKSPTFDQQRTRHTVRGSLLRHPSKPCSLSPPDTGLLPLVKHPRTVCPSAELWGGHGMSANILNLSRWELGFFAFCFPTCWWCAGIRPSGFPRMATAISMASSLSGFPAAAPVLCFSYSELPSNIEWPTFSALSNAAHGLKYVLWSGVASIQLEIRPWLHGRFASWPGKMGSYLPFPV